MAASRHCRLVLVQGKIAARRRQGVFADVQAANTGRAAAGGVEGKSAGITEQIQNGTPLSQRLDVAPVFPLIEKEAGFLSAQDIGFEAQSIFQKDNRPVERRAVKNPAVFQAKIVEGLFLDIATEPQNQAAFAFEQLGRFIEARQPCRRVKLEDARGVILIQNQPRPAVVLAVDAAKAGRLRIEQAPAKGKSIGRALLPPWAIDLLRLARVQNADANGGLRIKQSNGEEAVGAIEDDRQLAGLAGPILPAHALREDPRMPPAHNAFRRRRDAKAKTRRDLGCQALLLFSLERRLKAMTNDRAEK